MQLNYAAILPQTSRFAKAKKRVKANKIKVFAVAAAQTCKTQTSRLTEG
jgi:hypothetical protein